MMLTREILRCGDRSYTWQDALDCAAVEEGLRPLLRRWQAAAQAAALFDGEPDPSALQELVDACRYNLGLETAAATASWLGQWALGIEDLGEFAVREAAWLGSCHQADGGLVIAEFATALWQTAVCFGMVDVLVRPLARAALTGAEPGRCPEVVEAALGRQEAGEGARRLLAPDLLSFDYQWLHLANDEAAAEARCCLMHDGEDARELAQRIPAPYQTGHAAIGDWPRAWRAQLRSAQAGCATPPLRDVSGSAIILPGTKHAADLHAEAVVRQVKLVSLTQSLNGRENELQWAFPIGVRLAMDA